MNSTLLAAHYFFSLAAMAAFGTYIVLYFQFWHFSAWHIAVLMTVFTVMRMVCPTFFGWLSDRTGKKTVLIRWFSVGMAVCFACFFWIQTFYAFVLGMLVMGLCWSVVSPLIEALTFAEVSEKPSRYSTIRVWGSIGAVLSVYVVGRLIHLYSMHYFLWVIQITLLIALGVAFYLKEAPLMIVHTDRNEPIFPIFRQPGVMGLLFSAFLMSAAHGVYNTFMPIHLSHYHFTTDHIGMLWGLGVMVEILFFFFPRIIHQTSLHRILLCCFGVATLRFLMLGWGASSLILVITEQLMHGVTYGVHHIATISAVNRYFPGVHQSKGQTIYSGIVVCGGLVFGQLLSGFAMDRWGGEWAFTVSALLSFMGFLVVVFTVRNLTVQARG